MTTIYYIYILFCILFLIEKKAVNILICYIFILISISFLLPFINIYPFSFDSTIYSIHKIDQMGLGGIGTIGGEYISYIIILVQVSALTILFGFILMLYPSLALSSPLTPLQLRDSIEERVEVEGKNRRNGRYWTILIISILFIIVISNSSYISKYSNINIFSLMEIFNPKALNLTTNSSFNIDLHSLEFSSYLENSFLRKLGTFIYSNNIFSIKLILITLILLLAIVILFFLISL